MTHQEDGDTRFFGRQHQSYGGFSYLADSARGGSQISVEHGLDRIDDREIGAFGVERRAALWAVRGLTRTPRASLDLHDTAETPSFAVLDAFGRDEGFDVILDAQTVAFAAARVDVTTAIIDRFNQMIRSADAAPPADGQ